MNFTIKEYQDYLYNTYKEKGIDSSLFMKLVEEIGEVAEVFNKRDRRKLSLDGKNFKEELGYELVDVIHYAVAIAALNNIDLTKVIMEKDKKASVKYNHKINFENFLKNNY